MSKLYKRNCDLCKNPYKGLGYKYCSPRCANIGNKGRIKSREEIEKLKKALAGKKRPQSVKDKIRKTRKERGIGIKENNPNWRGGRSSLKNIIRTHPKMKRWKITIFKRDFYSCVFCGNKKKIEADHIKPFAVIFKENNISSFTEAMECNELWDIKNGRTLCHECHKLTDTYGATKKSTIV